MPVPTTRSNRWTSAQPLQIQPDSVEFYVAIAIDFGTTYVSLASFLSTKKCADLKLVRFSGVSWTWSGDSKNIRCVQRWTKSGEGQSSSREETRVPTRIRYHKRKVQAWGFGLDDEDTNDANVLEWFKLLLDYEELKPHVKKSPRVISAYKKMERHTKSESQVADTAVRVAADYIQKLWESVLEDIDEQITPDWKEDVDCKLSLTKPAIWSGLACARTEMAARRAIQASQKHFRRVDIELISEPEAAAHTVLSAPEITQRPDKTTVSNSIVTAK
jgi:molecular chaperone DnaK (HSP70)